MNKKSRIISTAIKTLVVCLFVCIGFWIHIQNKVNKIAHRYKDKSELKSLSAAIQLYIETNNYLPKHSDLFNKLEYKNHMIKEKFIFLYDSDKKLINQNKLISYDGIIIYKNGKVIDER